MTKIAKNTICLWYDDNAEEAAKFYALLSVQFTARQEIILQEKKEMC